MVMHNIREYEKKYAVVVFCALHVSRISYGVLKKNITCYSFRICILYCTCMYIYTVLRDAKKKTPTFI